MVEVVKRVVYFERLQDPVWLETLTAQNDVVVERLSFADPEPDNLAALGKAHAYQVSSARDEIPERYQVNAALLAACPKLLLVSTYGAGYDTVDLEACSAAGVAAVNQAGANKEAVAEHALAMMLTVSKRLGEADRVLRRERGFARIDLMGRNIHGKTLGIVGLGHIGSRMAELCGTLFRMRVLAYDPYLTDQQFRERGAEKTTLARLLRESDFVSLHCPLTAETRGMIGTPEFAAMKRGSIFIATSRGSIHDEAALAEALAEGRIAGAGLDVWEREPPPLEHPLLQLDNVVVSPHTAGVTHESRHDTAAFAAEQTLMAFRGETPPQLLNPEVWPAFVRRLEELFGAPAA